MSQNDGYDPDAIFREFDDDFDDESEDKSEDEEDFNDGSLDLLYSLEDDDDDDE